MVKIIQELRKIIDENPNVLDLYKRNLLKEYLQFFILDYVYSNKDYSQLIFYGGSALAQCYELPRLSEDLDFVDVEKRISLNDLAKDLTKYIEKELQLPVKVKIQKFRIYLKFPILKQLGFADESQSDLLNLKIEVFKGFKFCRKYGTEVKPIFRHNKSVLVRVFDLPTLMSTKIRAILYRKWEKVDKQGETLISVKGRDYFDLMWYLQKGVKPNLACIEKVDDMEALKKKMLRIIEKIDSRSIILDLESFVSDRNFVENLGNNIKEILKTEVKKMK
jgi:predicted nucleotidyltransferase component of viral defense system